MYNATLADFLTESETRSPNIETYKNQGDLENYAILVHALKSDSKYLGFTHLAELAYNHQIESQNHNQEYINTHYEDLVAETNRIIKVVKEYLG